MKTCVDEEDRDSPDDRRARLRPGPGGQAAGRCRGPRRGPDPEGQAGRGPEDNAEGGLPAAHEPRGPPGAGAGPAACGQHRGRRRQRGQGRASSPRPARRRPRPWPRSPAMDLMRAPGKDALAHAEQAVQAEATPAALAALARAQARVQDGTAALQTADKAVAAGSTSADAHEARGEALLAAGSYDEAAAAFRKALELDPEDERSRACAWPARSSAQGQAAQAVAEARKATEADPKSGAGLRRSWAWPSWPRTRPTGATPSPRPRTAAFLNEKDPLVQVAVGKVFEGGDNLDQAALAYKKALETDPGYTPARAALLSAQVRKGDTEAALVEAQKLAAEMPQSGEIQLELGRLLLRKGDFAGATPALEKAAAASPGVAEVHALLGYAYQAHPQVRGSPGRVPQGHGAGSQERRLPHHLRPPARAEQAARRGDRRAEEGDRHPGLQGRRRLHQPRLALPQRGAEARGRGGGRLQEGPGAGPEERAGRAGRGLVVLLRPQVGRSAGRVPKGDGAGAEAGRATPTTG